MSSSEAFQRFPSRQQSWELLLELGMQLASLSQLLEESSELQLFMHQFFPKHTVRDVLLLGKKQAANRNKPVPESPKTPRER